MSRVKVAGVVDRLPRGTLQDAPAEPPPAAAPAVTAQHAPAHAKRTGRPPKAPGSKAVGLTVTLWPHELEALEALRSKVNEGLPADVSRSDVARLAFRLLLEMSPAEVRAALAKRSK
jgi:hypothetical protein